MGIFDFLKNKNGFVSNDEINEKVGELHMVIESSFSLNKRGVVATGKIEKGEVRVNDKVKISRRDDSVVTAKVISVQKNETIVNVGVAGEEISLLLKGVEIDDVAAKNVIFK